MKEGIKKVLFVAPFPPPVHGSAVVSLQIKNSEIINESFRCDYVNLSTSRQMDEIGRGSIAKIWRMVVAFVKTIWHLLAYRYDLCYLAITCHGVGFLKDAPFVLLCKLFGQKIVIHQHNKGMANDVDKWPYRWLLPLCYKNVKVILLSWYLYADIERVVKKKDVFICPNGIKDKDTFKVVENSKISRNKELENRTPKLLFLSNLIESKGVLVLLDALKILNDKGFLFICNFVGGETEEIDEKRFIDEVEKRGLKDIAFYLGRKYGEEKEIIFENSDIFVFPTYYSNECFPLVLLEAMQHGLPCVTTDEGGIRDIVNQDLGFTIHGSHDGDLAEKTADALIKLILDAEMRKRMGETGKIRLKERFTEEMFEERIRDILENIVNNIE